MDIDIRPQPGRQEQFLSSPADITIYGGSAGGGKTWSLLLEGLRHKSVKGFGAVIFRRTFPEITNEGGLWDESENIYRPAGGIPTTGNLLWRFPAGSRISFAHLQHDKDLQKYDGAQICLLCFDQLEHFTERQFFYLLIRNRSTCGVKPYIRATCNPDPDSWLASFLAWWIDEDGYANLDRAGKVRYFIRVNDAIIWADTPEELKKRYPEQDPKSVTFIPATVYDNKRLLEKDPGYLANLKNLPLVERERFLGDSKRGGNWKIKPTAGKVFNRSWFEIVDYVPDGGIEGSGWDFAATEKSKDNPDPDYTARIKMRKVGGIIYILDLLFDRYAAGEIDRLMMNTSQQDRATAQAANARFVLRWEIEGGSAGLREEARMVRQLHGYDAKGVKVTGDKVTRARPLAVQAEKGNVKLLAGPWNDKFLTYFHGFPDLPHDDPIDAGTVIYNEIAEMQENPQPPKKQAHPFYKVKGI